MTAGIPIQVAPADAARRKAGVDPSAKRRQLRGIDGDEPEVGCGTPGNWLHAAQAV